jgi:hypothetical protein
MIAQFKRNTFITNQIEILHFLSFKENNCYETYYN